MSIGAWLAVLKLLLELAAYAARKAGQYEIEKAVLYELDIALGKRTRAAADARDGVLSGRVPEQPNDPHKRD